MSFWAVDNLLFRFSHGGNTPELYCCNQSDRDPIKCLVDPMYTSFSVESQRSSSFTRYTIMAAKH